MSQPILSLIERYLGKNSASHFHLKQVPRDKTLESYKITCDKGEVYIEANSNVALARGFYHYITNACNCIITWTGNNVQLPKILPPYGPVSHSTPFQYRYYLNVVTYGYTLPYWDWKRWEKEIDWMAVHGLNMPLALVGNEAILERMFRKLGFTDQEIAEYMTGPAHLPWNRMGNIIGWDGPLSPTWHQSQISLQRKILTRLQDFGMTPIVPAFAGFVPPSFNRLYPEIKTRQLSWGGFPKQFQATILPPDNDLFIKIGTMFVREWEKEFGKCNFYLADSFNEMDVPISKNKEEAQKELAEFGNAAFQAIHQANPDAVWTLQGWTFPFHKQDGKLFWTFDRLKALFKKIPDDKCLILDLANEYNEQIWNLEASWKKYEGFFNKMWIYSFIPNMGGKVALNGKLDRYASMSIDALEYNNRKNLVGFGFAPEGIENNDIIYELLADMGWSEKRLDLDSWIKYYCIRRYGDFPKHMEQAYECLQKSCFGTFTDHPRHRFQFRPSSLNKGTVHKSALFDEGVKKFLECAPQLKNSPLYIADAIELTAQYLGNKADDLLKRASGSIMKKKRVILKEAIELMLNIDKLLESHPNHKLSRWIEFARQNGTTVQEANQYEANAKRLITTWGGGVNDYSARLWAGLIRDYYVQRWILANGLGDSTKKMKKSDLIAWEEKWIITPGISKVDTFSNPIEKAIFLVNKY